MITWLASHGRWTYWQILNNKHRSTLLVLLLAAGQLPAAADWMLRAELIREPTPERFSVCFDHSCRSIVTRSFTSREWQQMTAPLRQPATSAAAERSAIAQAIALMEQLVGEKTGTAGDRGGNLAGFGQQGQMDCIDESNNTTTYLQLLQRDGLLRHHVLQDRTTRFGLSAGMPHTTAVILDVATQRRYAVDSWFFDNGEPPVIMLLEDWEAGWRPDGDRHE